MWREPRTEAARRALGDTKCPGRASPRRAVARRARNAPRFVVGRDEFLEVDRAHRYDRRAPARLREVPRIARREGMRASSFRGADSRGVAT